METVKNWLLGFAFCLAFVLLLGLLCFCLARPWYYRLFYPWDRFSGTVQVELDGEPAVFTAQRDAHGQERGALIRGSGSTRIALHASDYGVYGFTLRIQGLERPICLSALKWNWEVIRFDLTLTIDREDGTAALTGTVRHTNDRGQFEDLPVDEILDLTDERLYFGILW